MKAREVKRAKLAAKYAKKRAELKKIVNTGDPEAAYAAAQKLQDIPKNANPIRMHNRCKITGRPKGYMRQFGISRIQFREMASAGLLNANIISRLLGLADKKETKIEGEQLTIVVKSEEDKAKIEDIGNIGI